MLAGDFLVAHHDWNKMRYGAKQGAQNRRGVVAVFAAICMVVIVSVVAIVVDSGMVRDRRRHVQASADAAAMAAAIELFNNYLQVSSASSDPGGRARAGALSILQDNGYTPSNAEIIINIPPRESRSGFNGQPRLAEVIVTFHQARQFSTIMGNGDIPVRARAVARGDYAQIDDGVLVLDPDTKGAFNAHGNGQIIVHGADVIVNSNHSEAAITNGNGVGVVGGNPSNNFTPGFKITGGYSGGGFNPAPTTGVYPTPDPLRFLPAPDRNALSMGSITTANGVVTMTPGVYTTPVSFSGPENIVMEPGVYVFDQGFSVTGQGSLTGDQVMLYNEPHSSSHRMQIAGQGGVNLTAPYSGLYNGIIIFQNRRADVDVSITGNGNFNIAGTIYAANALVTVEGNGDKSVGSQYISRMLDVGGNGNVNIVYDPDLAPRTRILELVE